MGDVQSQSADEAEQVGRASIERDGTPALALAETTVEAVVLRVRVDGDSAQGSIPEDSREEESERDRVVDLLLEAQTTGQSKKTFDQLVEGGATRKEGREEDDAHLLGPEAFALVGLGAIVDVLVVLRLGGCLSGVGLTLLHLVGRLLAVLRLLLLRVLLLTVLLLSRRRILLLLLLLLSVALRALVVGTKGLIGTLGLLDGLLGRRAGGRTVRHCLKKKKDGLTVGLQGRSDRAAGGLGPKPPAPKNKKVLKTRQALQASDESRCTCKGRLQKGHFFYHVRQTASWRGRRKAGEKGEREQDACVEKVEAPPLVWAAKEEKRTWKRQRGRREGSG